MLEDQLGAHGPITRADAAEVALYWLAVVRPTREELEDILSRFPETMDES